MSWPTGTKRDKAVQVASNVDTLMSYTKGILQAVAMLGNCPPINGVTYWVDYDLGSATNDGLTPDKPKKLLSAAITASEAYRVAQTNVYTRNRIMVMGASVAYPAISALPNYCDIIGVGAEPRGNGAGIARIDGLAAADAVAGSCRGVLFRNLQFKASGAYWCVDLADVFRTIFDNCTFQTGLNATDLDGYLRVTTNAGGLVLKHCHVAGIDTPQAKVGIQMSGAHFNDCLIEDCVICGTTAGIIIDAGCTIAQSTVVRNNYIGRTYPQNCAKGVDDNATLGGVIYENNRVSANDAFEITEGASWRLLHNMVIDVATPLAEPKHADA